MTGEQVDLRLAVTDEPPSDGGPVKMRCREHNDSTASLAVYPDHLHCYGCGFTLGLDGTRLPGHVDPLAYLLGTEDVDRTQYASKGPLPDRRQVDAREVPLEPLPACLPTLYNDVLNSPLRWQRKEWLKARGLLTVTTNDPDVLLGHDGKRFVIPVFDRDRTLLTLRYRLDPFYCSETEVKKHKYLGFAGRNGRYLYPAPQVAADYRDYLVLCEGEFDTLRLWQENIPALTITNGAGQVDKLPALVAEHFPWVHRLYLAFDRDAAGHQATLQTVRASSAAHLSTAELDWPNDAKDVTDAFLKGYGDVFRTLGKPDELAAA